MGGLFPLGGGGGGATPATPLLSYQYNSASTLAGGELTRQSSTVTSLGLDSATPAEMTFRGQNSRGGTDSDVAGGNLVVASGAGTGAAAATSIAFQTPTVGATGSVQQTLTTRFTVATAVITVAAGIPLQLGTWTTAGRPSSPAAGMLGWNTTIGALDYYDGAAWTQSSTAWTVSSNNLIPASSNAYDLGDATHIVRSLYLGTSAILSSACTVEWNADLGLARLAAASLRVGLAPSATPVAQVLTVGESSRPATDSNVGGSSGTIRSGLGTGTGTASTLVFQTALPVASGTNTQTYDTKLTLAATAATFTTKIVAIDAVGILFTSGDVGLGRSAAGLLEINSGAAGTLRDLTLRTLKYSGGVTVSVTKSTMSGNLTIASTDPVYNFLDPNGADRDVTLPGSPPTGMSYLVKNTGAANSLVVKNNGGSTLATLAIGDINTFVYDGAAWQVL